MERRKIDAEKANKEAFEKLTTSRPFLVGLTKAIDVVPGMKENMILHAGPPITWDKMCGPMKGAVVGAIFFEGWARDEEEALRIASSGEIEFSPCHDHQTVGPMAGVVSPSMSVYIVKNENFGNFAYSPMNDEWHWKSIRMGNYSDEVIEWLRYLEDVIAPGLRRAMKDYGPIDLKAIISQALHMGDEVHNRHKAATSIFFRMISLSIVKTSDLPTAEKIFKAIDENEFTFLNLSMAAAKASLDAARDVEGSTMVVAMARNGTEFGIQVSGLGNEWFTSPAEVPAHILYFPGFKREDANPDIGDSSITETAGTGGFAIAASPAMIQLTGETAQEAIDRTLAMYEITLGENNVYTIPFLNFRGTPTGIDIRLVIEKNILPFINTAVAHKEPGVGMIGAGIANPPIEVFKKAMFTFAKKYL